MIRDEKDLQVVREQLGRAERALDSLRREITNERNFAVFSEAYVDQINELKDEIEAYEKAAKKGAKANSKNGKRRPRKAS
jgi:phage host-nuclease inhibitor protein Gam